MTDTTARTDAEQDQPSAPGRLALLLNHPLSTYYLLLGATLLLLVLGLIMVLSASSIESFRVFGSAYTLVQRQALFAVLGVVAMIFASRTSVQFWRGFAWVLFAIAFGLLVAVLVGASLLSQRNRRLDTWKGLLLPLLPVAVVMMVLVLLEGDFGNTLMLAAITMGMLFAAGAPMRLFAILAGAGVLGVVLLTLAAPYRMQRFTSWLDPEADRLGFGWQVTQGQYALGTGGFWGVGLGASREKWGSLPEAHTDFIFPVIGEELGLVGTVTVLALFGVLAFAIFRLSRNTKDPFVRLASAGVGSWIVIQAVVNIGAVLGLLPITGVPRVLRRLVAGPDPRRAWHAHGLRQGRARRAPGHPTEEHRRVTATALTCTSSSRRAGRAATSNRR
jgi:cell division protein FtsW